MPLLFRSTAILLSIYLRATLKLVIEEISCFQHTKKVLFYPRRVATSRDCVCHYSILASCTLVAAPSLINRWNWALANHEFTRLDVCGSHGERWYMSDMATGRVPPVILFPCFPLVIHECVRHLEYWSKVCHRDEWEGRKIALLAIYMLAYFANFHFNKLNGERFHEYKGVWMTVGTLLVAMSLMYLALLATLDRSFFA